MTFALVLILCLAFTLFPVHAGAESPRESDSKAALQASVLVITVNGVINPVAAEYIGKAVRRAAETGAAALVIELDTPGGLDTSMRSIVKDMISSTVPVIVYVSPSGARAASAGVFITLAAHIAAMAPGTNIGAAHPVAVGEKMDKVMAEKATNDAAAYIKSLAEQRGRNSKWAEDAVRKSVSATETEALKLRIIDLVVKDLPSLLAQVDGRRVTTAAGDQTLRTRDARVLRDEPGVRQKILNFISDPTIAYMLLLLGFYGLFFELTNPGVVFPGVFGAICLILAFYSFQTLPVNYAGLLLIILGIVLFILEVKVTSYGMLTVGGIASIVLGSLMLFESPDPLFKLSLMVVLPTALVTALFFALTVRLAYRAHRKRPVTGAEGLVGLEGIAKSDVDGAGGLVLVHGEIWSARSDDQILKDDRIIVQGVKGLVLKVRRASVP
ncbi:MAG: NfeD family protein [Chloroflexota bacterium]